MLCSFQHLSYKCVRNINHKGACIAYKSRYAVVFNLENFLYSKHRPCTTFWLDMGWR
jgi:hypothetical protein